MNTFIEVRNLAKAYPLVGEGASNYVFYGLNMTITRGSKVAIVGPSGSGKSTFLQLLSGLDLPSHGQVIVDGKNINEFSAEEAARFRNLGLGFVFQAHHLLPSLTAMENIMIPALAGHGGLSGNDLKSRAMELLSEVGLSNRANHLPGQLSGGECQRVAVARALINKPKLLLADEPTGALDHYHAKSLIELLHSLNHDHNLTLVMVTHERKFAQEMDEVWSFESGELKQRAL